MGAKTSVVQLKNGQKITSIPMTIADLFNVKKGDKVEWSFNDGKELQVKFIRLQETTTTEETPE
mgnify:CR=1 FL=1